MALAASSGQKIWDKHVLPSDGPGYFDAAPLVVDGMVYVGNGGSDVGAIGKMFALDARDGHLVWTRSLVATGNEPGADTWPKKPGIHIAGGGTWTSYTFDRQHHVLYVPVGNPGPDFDGDYRPARICTRIPSSFSAEPMAPCKRISNSFLTTSMTGTCQLPRY